MREGKWLFFGLAVLFLLLIAAWRMAITLNEGTQVTPHHTTIAGHGDEGSNIRVTGGLLVAEIPERGERWSLRFTASHYDTEKQSAITKDGICQVSRNNQVITVFHAPNIVVRFKEREMEMKGGVKILAMLPRLKVRLETLKWHWETGQLIGRGKVKIEGERFSAIADRLEGDTTLQQISLVGNIHLTWDTESGDRK
ncbi:hypothetical protein [Fervidibacter sacchari]